MFRLQCVLMVVFVLAVTVPEGVLAATSAFFGSATSRSFQEVPEPVLVVPDAEDEFGLWSMTSGFIYLVNACNTQSSPASIRRRAVNGMIVATLESVTGTPAHCTFSDAAADASGIYYYNRNRGRLEAIYSDAPDDPPTPLATIGDWSRLGSGDGIGALRLNGSYVYWMEVFENGEFRADDITIKRVSKRGGSQTTLFSYSFSGVSYEGLGVTDRNVWWTDKNGLNRISNCTDLQPCAPGPVVKTVETSVNAMDGHIQISGSTVYWWGGGEDQERIRRTSCSLFSNTCSTSTVYSANEGIDIIGLAANSTTAFWVENVPQLGRRLRRKVLSGSTVETIANRVSHGAPYVDVDGVYFKTSPRAISSLPLDAAAFNPEIGIRGWEVTQGMQNLANDNPRVAGKSTYVRLYPTLESGSNAMAVFAELHGSRNGQPLPGSPLYPMNNTIAVWSGLSLANRGWINSGWLFRLPDSWTRTGDTLIPQEDTTISLRAVVDPYGAYADTDSIINNTIRGDFLFTAKAPTCMTMRPVVTTNHYEPVYGINVGQVVELTESMLPTSKLITFRNNEPLREIDWCWKGPVYGPFCFDPYELSSDASGLLTKMGWHDFWADSPSICFSNNARTLYAGIVHEDAVWKSGEKDVRGTSRSGGDQLLTKIPRYGTLIDHGNSDALTMVHEIGHNYSRRHIDCGNPDEGSIDTDYEYPTNMLDADLPLGSPDLHFGFDPLSQTPINPKTAADFMAYNDPPDCNRSWYSDYTWKAIYNNTHDPVFVSPFTGAASSAADIVRVAGLINLENNSATLEYAWKISMSAATPSQQQRWLSASASALDHASLAANYHLQLIGVNEEILADQSVELAHIDDGHQDGPQPFDLILQAPAEAVARLQLMADDTVLATLAPGTSQPTVAIDQPAGGTTVEREISIGWTASDPDGDQLAYTIQYSPNNGQEWYPLLVNYGGTGADREVVTLDIASEAGSNGASALVRVLVSDGYNTSVATSQPFTVVQRPPFAAITSPTLGQTFVTSDVIALRGFASDPEDGLIAEDRFVWSTGEQGQTAELEGLAPGTHTLQLTVTDSNGLDATANTSFHIAPLAVPETRASFTLDGRCDDAGYQTAPQLSLSPYTNGLRASARTIHTSGSLWLCLSNLQSVGGYVGLLLDADNSQEATVQSGDFGYFIQRDGTSFRREGNGQSFERASAANLSARIDDNGAAWSAELMINQSAFGDWRKRVSLTIGHFEQSEGKVSTWPRSAAMTTPQSWGQTNLGLVATLTSVTPESAVFGTGSIALTVSGLNFDMDNVILWNDVEISTTLVDTTTLTASVPATLVTSSGTYSISVGSKEQDSLTTAATPFTVYNPKPTIAHVTPNSANIGSGDMTVSIAGDGFVNGADVIWAGEIHRTNFISSTELRIRLTAAELAASGTIPLVVVNPEPHIGPSNTSTFTILSGAGTEQLFLPIIRR